MPDELPITPGQRKAFEYAFLGHPDYTQIQATAKGLTKDQAHAIVSVFYGASYRSMKAVSEQVRENSLSKIPKALALLKEHGYEPKCRLCHEPRVKCCC